MEFCGGHFSLKTSVNLGLQILERLQLLHQNGVIFRDLKPENFLLGAQDGPNKNIVYMVDFGLATPFIDSR